MQLQSRILLCVLALSHCALSQAFQHSIATSQHHQRRCRTNAPLQSNANDDVHDTSTETDRRSFITGLGVSCLGAFVAAPTIASAGIDVSGIRVDGAGNGNPAIAAQLKAFDGSATSRIQEIKAAASSSPSNGPFSVIRSSQESAPAEDAVGIATWAYRTAPGFAPKLATVGVLKNLYRCNDQIVAPESTGRRALNVQFEFPSDWLQLDRAIGGLQYVDQRNGDKLYLLRARLPEGTTLETVSKSYFGETVFNPKGSIAKSGNTIEEYKVSTSQILSDCPTGTCAVRRRLKVKYATVTGNGLRVERRALVDAYEVPKSDEIVMLVTSSNAVKFENKGSAERETVENIVASFIVE